MKTLDNSILKTIQVDLSPEEYASEVSVRRAVARVLSIREVSLEPFRIIRRSIDCRRQKVLYHCTIEIGQNTQNVPIIPSIQSTTAPRLVIVGAGPAGLFAALRALQLGMKPIIIERGKPVQERKKDIVNLVRTKEVNPDSNWCFGEGGAGTYSDGKLYTRSTKRGDVNEVLHLFVEHGADPDIMVDVHAHIGTDRLPAIISRMRETIINCGGEYHFNTRVTDLNVKDGHVRGVFTADGDSIEGDAVILATGHSARDIYELFARHGWLLEAKPFALGVRVEHPQELINEIQYHGKGYSRLLPPATYSLVTQVESHGVFSFCMCPGGVIVPASTASGQQVVNGMSNAARNSGFANSGIAVTVNPSDVGGEGWHALLDFQKAVEQRAFEAAGAASMLLRSVWSTSFVASPRRVLIRATIWVTAFQPLFMKFYHPLWWIV